MDYEEKIRNLYNKVRFSSLLEDSYVAKKMEEVFPELKEENVDERIRNELIWGFKHLPEETFAGISINDVISWLEKKGNEPNWCHHKVDLSNCSEEYRKAYYDGWNNCNMQHSQCKSELDDVLKCLINGMKFYYEDNKDATWGTDKWSMPVKHIIEVLEKQCEQKSYASETMNEKGDFDNGFTRMMEKEQNHAWSEEDDNFIKSIIAALSIFAEEKKANGCFDNEINWLKSLKERVIPQSKQEWGEDDKQYLLICKNALTKYQTTDKWDAHIIFNWLENKLKSIRPQNTWKPSDEQVKALADALSLAKNCGKESSFDLRTLYIDLKKLK